MHNRFSRDRPRLNDTLDVIKFLCKDLWSLVFGKNIDNLKTNHRVRTRSVLRGQMFGLVGHELIRHRAFTYSRTTSSVRFRG